MNKETILGTILGTIQGTILENYSGFHVVDRCATYESEVPNNARYYVAFNRLMGASTFQLGLSMYGPSEDEAVNNALESVYRQLSKEVKKISEKSS